MAPSNRKVERMRSRVVSVLSRFGSEPCRPSVVSAWVVPGSFRSNLEVVSALYAIDRCNSVGQVGVCLSNTRVD